MPHVSRTLTFIDITVATAICFAFLFIWRTRKTYPGFGLWTMANLVCVLGYVLLLFRGQISDVITVVVAGLLQFLYFILFFEGIRRFKGKANIYWTTPFFVLILIVLFIIFTFVINDINIRIVAISILICAVCLQCTIELIKEFPRDWRDAKWFTGLMFFLYGLVMLTRAILIYFSPLFQDLLEPDLVVSISSYLIPIPIGIMWSFGLVTLNSERLETDLKETQKEMHHLAITDSLTGIFNHRYFFELGKIETLQARRYHNSLGVILFDIDFFKHINDTYGHPAGDAVLIAVVNSCQRSLRESDILGRLGGDEFGIILPRADLQESCNAAGRLRENLTLLAIPYGDVEIHITISAGVSIVSANEDGIDHAIKRADEGLYQVKRNNRNQVIAIAPD